MLEYSNRGAFICTIQRGAAALEMAEMAAESGVEMIAAVSHANLPDVDPEKYMEKYKRCFCELRDVLEHEKIPVKLYPGMEILAGSKMTERLRDKKLLTINNSAYPLVEFYFDTEVSGMSRYLKQLSEAGYIPVLAHPERYSGVRHNPEILYRWKQQGIVIQLNKGSILGEFGRRVESATEWMLRQGLADVVASDAHDGLLRTADMEGICRKLEFMCGYSGAELLLNINPWKICHNKRLR